MENGENRAEKVKQAVQFLADSRVAAAPLERAVGFLQRKGLTAGEIREALNKSTKTITPEIEKLIDNPEKATTATTPAQSASPQVAQQVIPGQAPVQTLPPGTTVPMYAYAPSPTIVQPPSTRSKWKEAILWVGALSAIGLVLRELLRKYIVPIYFPEEVEGKRLKDVQTEVKELGRSVHALQQVLKDTKSSDDLREATDAMKTCTQGMKEMMSQNQSIDTMRHKIDELQSMILQGRLAASAPLSAAYPSGTHRTAASDPYDVVSAATAAAGGGVGSDPHTSKGPTAVLRKSTQADEDFFNIEPGSVSEIFRKAVDHKKPTVPVTTEAHVPSGAKNQFETQMKQIESDPSPLQVNTAPPTETKAGTDGVVIIRKKAKDNTTTTTTATATEKPVVQEEILPAHT